MNENNNGNHRSKSVNEKDPGVASGTTRHNNTQNSASMMKKATDFRNKVISGQQ